MKSHCPIKSVVSLLGVVWLLNGCYKEEQQASPELAGNEHVLVDFATPGIGSETQIVKSGYDRERVLKFPTTRAVVALDENVTVRIIAYRSATDNPSTVNYVKDVAYVMRSGSLVPCTVDSEGNYKALDQSSRMRLEPGNYDFYAIMPALPLTDQIEVSVAHGVDYASSLTASYTITADTPSATVTLTTLERQCSQLSFSTIRVSDRVTSIQPHSITVGSLTVSPATLRVGEGIALGSDGGSYSFPESAFVKGTEVGQYSCVEEVLPSSKSFTFSMSVTFNEAPSATELATDFVNLPFEKGKRYNFAIELKSDKILLNLQVTPWNTDAIWYAPDVGAPGGNTTVVEVGSWDTEWKWNTPDVGGGYFTPVIIPDSWTLNPAWSSIVGN